MATQRTPPEAEGGLLYPTRCINRIRLTKRYRPRLNRSLKDQHFNGQASWMSSNVNLVNTSMPSRFQFFFSRYSQGNSHWRGGARHAACNVAHGHIIRNICDNMVRARSCLWAIPPISVRSISGTGQLVLLRPVANHVSQCGGRVRRRDCNQVFWCWC